MREFWNIDNFKFMFCNVSVETDLQFQLADPSIEAGVQVATCRYFISRAASPACSTE